MLSFIAVLSELREITPKEYREMKRSNQTFAVLFFAPWCGHCKAFKPEYEQAAGSVKDLADLVAMNCEEEANKEVCGQNDVKGYPTLKMFNHNGKRKAALVYEQERTQTEVLKWVRANHKKPFVVSPTVEQLLTDIQNLPKVVVVTIQSQKAPSMLNYVSKNIKVPLVLKMEFEADDVDKLATSKLAGLMDAQKSSLVYCTETCKKYEGENNKEAITEWVNDVAK